VFKPTFSEKQLPENIPHPANCSTQHEQAKIKKQIKEKEKKLDDKLLRKYAELTAEDVKRLVVEERWLARLEEGIKDELDNIVMSLTSRIKELAERYAEPMPDIEQEVEGYESNVKEHLKVMRFETEVNGYG